MRRALLALLAFGLLLPAPASADNTITIVGGELTFTSEDPGVANEVLIEPAGSDVRFFEPKDPYGINYPSQCRPGRTQGQYVIEVFCPRSAITSLSIDIGPGEDRVEDKLDAVGAAVGGGTGADAVTTAGANDVLSGQQGNDTLTAAGGDDELAGDDGNDTLDGGAGNDKLTGGAGADTLTAGDGDDSVRSADGIADKVDCGAGTDTAIADTLDELAGCENVQRQAVAPPPGAPAAEDHAAPKLSAGAVSTQRAARAGVALAATSSEVGLLQAAGYLDAGGINTRLAPVTAKVTVAGGGAQLRLRLSARALRLVRADLRRHRRPRVRITVSAVDAAGNTSRARHFWVALR